MALRNEVRREWPITVEELRHASTVQVGRVNLLARLEGEPAGCAFAGPMPFVPDSSYGEAIACVPAAARHRGVGSALYAAASRHVQGHDKRGIQTAVVESEVDALRSLTRRGFEEVGREQTVALDLRGWEPPGRQASDEFEVADLASRPDALTGMWEVDGEAVADVPGAEPETPVAFDAFCGMLERPGHDPRLVTIALAGDHVVGYAVLVRNQVRRELGNHEITGVRRAWRRRGVASALKRAQLVRAKALGLALLRAQNELRNEPIRRLNERLGYRREPDKIVLRGPLAGDG